MGARLPYFGAALAGLELEGGTPMDRREFIAAAGTLAAAASASLAFAQAGEEPMPTPKYKALEEAAAHCVATGNDCLRHCLGMYKMKDTSMAGCADTAFQLVAACGALAALAAVNSEHLAIWPRQSRWSARTARRNARSGPKSPNARPAATRVRPVPRNAVRPLPRGCWTRIVAGRLGRHGHRDRGLMGTFGPVTARVERVWKHRTARRSSGRTRPFRPTSGAPNGPMR